MNILMCAEFFHPSIGGVQEVTKQLAMRFILNGHSVTVATTAIPERLTSEFDGISVESFNISGNYANGMNGEVARYKNFVKSEYFDLIFIYAAQQWTLDALIHDLPNIKAKKVIVPCGFSGLYLDIYKNYYDLMPSILNKFDAVIFHSKDYRDYNFAVEKSIRNIIFIPNGADNKEFSVQNSSFRFDQNIPEDVFLILTVGSLNGSKGHLELAESMALLESSEKITLILNGNQNKQIFDFKALILRFRTLNLLHLKILVKNVLHRIFLKSGLRVNYFSKLTQIIKEVNSGKHGSTKRIILLDLPRSKLVDCYFDSDLFVLASNIEYSPLVLFEACAAGLPFLSVPVGNAMEIAKWTGGGIICPANTTSNGNTMVNPKVLADKINYLLKHREELKSLGSNGKKSWIEKFNWDSIAAMYEQTFLKVLANQKI